MKSEDLEKIMKEKVKPIIDEAISSSIGIKISELSKDLTKKLRNPYFDFIVDANIPFKEAKKLFNLLLLILYLFHSFLLICLTCDSSDYQLFSFYQSF